MTANTLPRDRDFSMLHEFLSSSKHVFPYAFFVPLPQFWL